MRTMLLTVILVTLVLSARPAAAADDPVELARAVEQHYSQVKDFSARFEQVVTRAHLPDRPATKSGRVYFKKPGMMRWDYLEPDKVHYVSDGLVLWNYIPESKLAYRMEVRDSELFYALKFLFGEGSLEKDFDVSAGAPDSEGYRVLVVKPRTSEQNFQELRLLVEKDSPRIAGTVLLDPAGNSSRLKFIKVSTQSLPDAGFRFTPPADVQVEDLSRPAQPTP